MVVYWDAPNTLTSLTVSDGSITLNGFTLNASTWVNITILSWPDPRSGEYRQDFIFLANATTGTDVDFSFTSEVRDIRSWRVNRDGLTIQTGDTPTVSFSNAAWTTDVNRRFLLIVSSINAQEEWFIQYGPAWVTLFTALIIFAVILVSFYVGIKRRRKSGKLWKFMPRKWKR